METLVTHGQISRDGLDNMSLHSINLFHQVFLMLHSIYIVVAEMIKPVLRYILPAIS